MTKYILLNFSHQTTLAQISQLAAKIDCSVEQIEVGKFDVQLAPAESFVWQVKYIVDEAIQFVQPSQAKILVLLPGLATAAVLVDIWLSRQLAARGFEPHAIVRLSQGGDGLFDVAEVINIAEDEDGDPIPF